MRFLLMLMTFATVFLSGCSVGGGGYGLATLAVGYWVVDPRAPTWNVQMDTQENNHYAIQLRTKPFTNGGDGEARTVFKSAAEQLVSQERAGGYEIVSYEEGIENEFLGGRRYASGVIRLVPRLAEPSSAGQTPGWLDARR